MTRLGSLCTGVGGLDLAVEHHYGAELAWCAETDPDASTVLDVRFPGVANVGDFRQVTPEPVDVLCAGFPCQPVSTAGRRRGVDDERWLWDDIAELVGRMDPPPGVLVLENVAGLLTAGGGDALGRVVHRLAALGYVGRWGVVAASHAGAPHRRERWFCVAHASGERPIRSADDGKLGGPRSGVDGKAAADAADVGSQRAGSARGRRTGPEDRRGDVADPGGVTLGPQPVPIGWRADPLVAGPHRQAAAHTAFAERGDPQPGGLATATQRAAELGECDRSATWGDYWPAITRWEHVVGRPAPDPLDGRRLNPRFVEWMMGLPDGWVDVGISRSGQLRCLGNAVVPQQAALALDLLEVSR